MHDYDWLDQSDIGSPGRFEQNITFEYALLTAMKKVLKIGDHALQRAATIIMKGGVVAYPTDTVYGLGCDPLNELALKRLVQAKNRKQGRMPVLVDSKGRAEELGKFDTLAIKLARNFWPGSLTLVVPTRVRLPDMITGQSREIGLRIPRHEFAIELVRASGGALVGTSANVSGRGSLESALDVYDELGENIDLILDGGSTGSGLESSVVRIDGAVVSVLREKSIAKDEIFRCLDKSRNISQGVC